MPIKNPDRYSHIIPPKRSKSTNNTIKLIDHETALRNSDNAVGFPMAGTFCFHPLWQDIIAAHPELMD